MIPSFRGGLLLSFVLMLSPMPFQAPCPAAPPPINVFQLTGESADEPIEARFRIVGGQGHRWLFRSRMLHLGGWEEPSGGGPAAPAGRSAVLALDVAVVDQNVSNLLDRFRGEEVLVELTSPEQVKSRTIRCPRFNGRFSLYDASQERARAVLLITAHK
ncbi:hypothetical protein [Roseiconus nitratireducens]|uniref:hypothetical protein n=1 Tax=Roseiconus nitratireducens TaxID=2605748 RepID=UPI00137609D7|nr:hypothetical protein [Roseiconus nitratireducens]